MRSSVSKTIVKLIQLWYCLILFDTFEICSKLHDRCSKFFSRQRSFQVFRVQTVGRRSSWFYEPISSARAFLESGCVFRAPVYSKLCIHIPIQRQSKLTSVLSANAEIYRQQSSGVNRGNQLSVSRLFHKNFFFFSFLCKNSSIWIQGYVGSSHGIYL